MVVLEGGGREDVLRKGGYQNRTSAKKKGEEGCTFWSFSENLIIE